MTTDAPTGLAESGQMLLWGWNGINLIEGFDTLTPDSTPPPQLPARWTQRYDNIVRGTPVGGPAFDNRSGLLYRVEGGLEQILSLIEYRLDRPTGTLARAGEISRLGAFTPRCAATYSRATDALCVANALMGTRAEPFRDYRAQLGTRKGVTPLEKKIGDEPVWAFDTRYDPGPPAVNHVYAATARSLVTFRIQREAPSLDREPADDTVITESYELGGGCAVGVSPLHSRVFLARDTASDTKRTWPATDTITRLVYTEEIEPQIKSFPIPSPWVGVGYMGSPRFCFVRRGSVEYVCYPVFQTDKNRYGVLCFDTTADTLSSSDVIQIPLLTAGVGGRPTYPVLLSPHVEPGLLCIAVTGEDAPDLWVGTVSPATRKAVVARTAIWGGREQPLWVSGGTWVDD
ncbi:hypothetical protein FGW37_31015 [Streptomyces rectiverticillatus]|uniref:hypothetical protein n=1 Tax=Streptomyces rectiverticillatus TaxID=173860 RepID=UPI0015C39F1D|nr:hypothetical protein [Streptomyces rectiverticillatus]QLE75427.1 hypothetical protein FGW37_31015 [Streptomyces rectiverticillatus]